MISNLTNNIPKLDLGINKIAPVFNEDNESGFEYKIQTEHLTEDNEKIFLDMEHNESEGTNKIFSISQKRESPSCLFSRKRQAVSKRN